MKNKSLQFWYPIKTVGQLTFEGQTVLSDIPQEGHIYYMGRLMCRQSMERLKAECGAKKHRMVSVRIQSVGLCERCQEKYKENEGLEWAHWVNGKEIDASKTVKINQQLLDKKQ